MKKCYLFLIVGLFFITLTSNNAFAQVTNLHDTNSSGTNIDVGQPANGFTSSYSNFYATWTGQAGVSNYFVGVYNNSGADLGDQLLPSSATSAAFVTAKQVAGTIINIKVTSYSNTMGNIGVALTSGVTIDTLINAGQVYIVNSGGSPISILSSTTTILANWTGFSDPSLNSSGTASTITFQWAIGTIPGGTNIQGFTAVGIVGTTASNAGLALTPFTTYYVTVQATNLAGISVTTSSAGGTVEPTSLTVTGLSGGAVTIATNSGALNYVNVLDPVHDATGAITQPPPTDVFPFGVFSYTISGLNAYGNASVTYTLPSALSTSARWYWYKGASAYSNWTDITDFVTRVSDTVFTANLTDGGIGDAGIAGDGKIIDPIGPGIPDPASGPESSGQRVANALGLGGGGSCGVIGLDAIALIGVAYLFKRRFLRRNGL